jgi:tripartite motif-containing protein 37
MISEVHKKPTTNLSTNVSSNFISEFIPEYDKGTFTILNFSEAREMANVVYSTPIVINGLFWRLKVYPNGTGMARGTFLSVFLEMWKGLDQPKKYQYKVEMINHLSEEKSMERTFSSLFEIGECWGYNRFYRISELESNGFLDNTDTLILNFYVRPINYYQKCVEQNQYIKQIEEEKREIMEENNVLKSKVLIHNHLNEKHSGNQSLDLESIHSEEDCSEKQKNSVCNNKTNEKNKSVNNDDEEFDELSNILSLSFHCENESVESPNIRFQKPNCTSENNISASIINHDDKSQNDDNENDENKNDQIQSNDNDNENDDDNENNNNNNDNNDKVKTKDLKNESSLSNTSFPSMSLNHQDNNNVEEKLNQSL